MDIKEMLSIKNFKNFIIPSFVKESMACGDPI